MKHSVVTWTYISVSDFLLVVATFPFKVDVKETFATFWQFWETTFLYGYFANVHYNPAKIPDDFKRPKFFLILA